MTYPEQPFEPRPGQRPHSWEQPWQSNPPPPVDPQPVNYPEHPASYPPPPDIYPPPFYAGSSGYQSYPGYPNYPGVPAYPDPYDPYRASTVPGTNGLAIGSLAASILGFPLLSACFTGVAGWVAGIVLGIVALNQIKRTNQSGRGMAIAGIAVGAAGLVLGAIMLLVYLIAISRPSY